MIMIMIMTFGTKHAVRVHEQQFGPWLDLHVLTIS